MFASIPSKTSGPLPAVGRRAAASTQPNKKLTCANVAAAPSSNKAASAEAKPATVSQSFAASSTKKSQYAVVRWVAAFTAWVGLILAGASSMAQRSLRSIKSLFARMPKSLASRAKHLPDAGLKISSVPAANSKPLPDAGAKTSSASTSDPAPLPVASAEADEAPARPDAERVIDDLAPPLFPSACCRATLTTAASAPVQKAEPVKSQAGGLGHPSEDFVLWAQGQSDESVQMSAISEQEAVPAISQAVVLYRSPESFAPWAKNNDKAVETSPQFILSLSAAQIFDEALFVCKYANEMPPKVADRILTNNDLRTLQPALTQAWMHSAKAYLGNDNFVYTLNTLLDVCAKNRVRLITDLQPADPMVFAELKPTSSQQAFIVELPSDGENGPNKDLPDVAPKKQLKPLRLHLTPFGTQNKKLSSDHGGQNSADLGRAARRFQYAKGLGRSPLLN